MPWRLDAQALENTLNCLMNCITDADLPVRIQAAIALPELVRYERIRERMLPNLGRILQGELLLGHIRPTRAVKTDPRRYPAELLKLSSEVDLDALTNTTRSMVAEFSEEVVPFALELSQSLVSSSFIVASKRSTDNSMSLPSVRIVSPPPAGNARGAREGPRWRRGLVRRREDARHDERAQDH